MKTRLAGAVALLILTVTRLAGAVARPAPGADAALHGAEPGNYRMTIGIVVAIVVAIVSGIWFFLANAQKGKPDK